MKILINQFFGIVYFIDYFGTMNTLKGTKINHLLHVLPKGAVITSAWMALQGISLDLQKRYRHSGWFESVGTGAMKRSGEQLSLAGGIFALQEQLYLSVHPGAMTALGMQGKAHYLRFSNSDWELFGQPKESLPKWFKSYDWEAIFHYHMTSLFPSEVGFSEVEFQGLNLKVSSPPRALMECLYLVPQSQNLKECFEVMESLNNLRPDKVSELLQLCSSVKVKRLFMYLAEKADHQWVKYLDLEGVDFGQGKRSLVKGGTYISKYQITVPDDIEQL